MGENWIAGPVRCGTAIVDGLGQSVRALGEFGQDDRNGSRRTRGFGFGQRRVGVAGTDRKLAACQAEGMQRCQRLPGRARRIRALDGGEVTGTPPLTGDDITQASGVP